MRDRRGSLVGGLLLILIGLGMLLNRLHVRLPDWELIYPFIFVLLGLASAYRIRGRGHADGVFGTVFFLSLGAFFILRNFDFIPYFHSWPIFPIAIGMGMMAQIIFVPSRWGVIIPGAVLVVFGVALLFEELDYWYFYDVVKFWPVILIACGIGIVLNGLRRRA